MSSKYSGSTAAVFVGKRNSDRATDTADIWTNYPILDLQGSTTSSALGLIIRMFAEDVDASTNVYPTTTPNSSVKSRSGTINAQDPNCPPFNEKGATTSLSGGSTTAINNNPLTSGVGFCWCNCNVDRPSAHNWPVRRSNWCGRHDCRASVPNNPSEPILATTQHILHFSPGKTPECSNGWETISTSWAVQSNSVMPYFGRPPSLTPECSSGWEPASSSGILKL